MDKLNWQDDKIAKVDAISRQYAKKQRIDSIGKSECGPLQPFLPLSNHCLVGPGNGDAEESKQFLGLVFTIRIHDGDEIMLPVGCDFAKTSRNGPLVADIGAQFQNSDRCDRLLWSR